MAAGAAGGGASLTLRLVTTECGYNDNDSNTQGRGDCGRILETALIVDAHFRDDKSVQLTQVYNLQDCTLHRSVQSTGLYT